MGMVLNSFHLLFMADEWRHWSSPAKDVHDVLSEILLTNQLNKQYVNLVVASSNHIHQNDSLLTAKPANKLQLDAKSNPENSSKRDVRRASVNSSLSSGVLEPTVCSSIESLESTPRSSRPIPLNRRSSSKKGPLKKPPPHLFKVVVGNGGPAAKTGSAIIHQARKTEARKISTPSPLYKRRSGTLVQKPVRISGELRSSHTSQNSSIRCSVEGKRLTDSASLRRSTEKFVEACRALMEEEEQLKRANGQAAGKAVHFSNSPPIVIRSLLFESPGMVKVKPAVKAHKNWLSNRFSKYSSAKDSSVIKPKVFKSSSRDLPTLISRLPAQKVEAATVPVTAEAPKDVKDAKSMRESLPGQTSLPLPPARQADYVLKNSARGMALKASKDKKSGYTSYALEPTVLLSSSREGLAEVDSNSVKEKDKKRCSVGCPPKDPSAPSAGKKNENSATPTGVNLPNYMKARAGSGPGKENNSKSINPTSKHILGLLLNIGYKYTLLLIVEVA